jgi:hypothetical protein
MVHFSPLQALGLPQVMQGLLALGQNHPPWLLKSHLVLVHFHAGRVLFANFNCQVIK